MQCCADPGLASGAGAEVVFLVIVLRRSAAVLHQLLISRFQVCCRVTVPLITPLLLLADRLAIVNAIVVLTGLAAPVHAVFVVDELRLPQVAVEDHFFADAATAVLVCLLVVVGLGLHLASLSQGWRAAGPWLHWQRLGSYLGERHGLLEQATVFIEFYRLFAWKKLLDGGAIGSFAWRNETRSSP